MLTFQPQALASISPTISMDDAAHRLVGLLPGSTEGRVSYTDAETLADFKVDYLPTPQMIERVMTGRNVLLDGLRSGALHAYLGSYHLGDLCLEVPREVWLNRNNIRFDEPLRGEGAIVGWTDDLKFIKPSLSTREFDNWFEIGRQRVDAATPPPPSPKVRVRMPSAKQKSVPKFISWFDALESPPPGSLLASYKGWCQKHKFPSYGKAEFYRMVNVVRNRSGLKSDNDT